MIAAMTLGNGAPAHAPAAVVASHTPSTLDRLRRRGVQAWAVIGWIGLAVLVVQHWLVGASTPMVPVIAIGLVANAVPTLMAVRGRCDTEARMVMGALASFLPAMLVLELGGHMWQMDAHMYFFVAMAGLVVLCDWRPIALATVLIALHHLVLQGVAPDWVFTGSGNLGRVLFHAVAVVLQCAVLVLVTIRLERLITAQDGAIDRAEELAAIANDERARAEQALAKAGAAEQDAARERAAREAAAARVAGERRGELVTLANEFERSVTSVVHAIGTATARLEQSADRLGDSTQDTNAAVGEVTTGAARAADEITQVTGAIRDLSESIRTIASAAAVQADLTGAASGSAQHSVRTIAHLERRASQIESLVDDIREIAGKTNLLALNATIEAARAGEAGRGFTVVAAEVKTLAADTTRASDTISGLLAGIRDGITESATTLRDVNDAIAQVAAAAGGIASAVGEHQATAGSLHDTADRAADSAAGIERRMAGVADAAGTAATLCSSLRGSASELGVTARELRASTESFVSFLRDGQAAAA
ncbi:MAG: methyl-accepting chemotaxis protein [Pseudomonadota bacterium]